MRSPALVSAVLVLLTFECSCVDRVAFAPVALTSSGDINYDIYNLRSPRQGLTKRNATNVAVWSERQTYECQQIVALRPIHATLVDDFGIEVVVGFQTTIQLSLVPSSKVFPPNIFIPTSSKRTTTHSQRIVFDGIQMTAPQAGVYRFRLVALQSNRSRRNAEGFVDIAIVPSTTPSSMIFDRVPSGFTNVYTSLTQQPLIRLIDVGYNTIVAGLTAAAAPSVAWRVVASARNVSDGTEIRGTVIYGGNVSVRADGIAAFTELDVQTPTPLSSFTLHFSLVSITAPRGQADNISLDWPMVSSFCNTSVSNTSLIAYMYPERGIAQTAINVFLRGGVYFASLAREMLCKFNDFVFPAAFIDECNVMCVLTPAMTSSSGLVELSVNGGRNFSRGSTYYPLYKDRMLAPRFDNPTTDVKRLIALDPFGLQTNIGNISVVVADMFGALKFNWSTSSAGYNVTVAVRPTLIAGPLMGPTSTLSVAGVASFSGLYLVGFWPNTNISLIFTATDTSAKGGSDVLRGLLSMTLAFNADNTCIPPPVIFSMESAGCLSQVPPVTGILTGCRTGELVTVIVRGIYFGLSGAIVMLNNEPCDRTTHDSTNRATMLNSSCVFRTGGRLTVVTSSGLRASTNRTAGSLDFLVNDPVNVTAVAGCPFDMFPSTALCPSSATAAPVRVTIFGSNFGVSNASVQFVKTNVSTTIRCVTLEHSAAAPTTRLTCLLPNAVGTGYIVTVRNRATQQLGVAANGAAINFDTTFGVLCPADSKGFFCSNRGRCDLTTGNCTCPADSTNGYWIGVICQSCQAGYYGSSCAKKCPQCSQFSRCDDGYLGSGVCLCNYGYAGPLCNQPCPGGGTTPCNSHGTCISANISCLCDATSATGYWTGTACDACLLPWSGVQCRTLCPIDPAGRVCGGKGVCADGKCKCDAGFCDVLCNSTACSGCPVGRFGTDCSGVCPGGAARPCSGNGFCNDGPLGNGLCSCSTGWGGHFCNITCPGGPSAPCSGHGTCAQDSGVCSCDEGYALGNCSVTCPGGPGNTCFGNGLCNTTSAECECFFGYSGANCTVICPGGSTSPCNLHGLCSQRYSNCSCYADTVNGYWDGPTCSYCLSDNGGWWGPTCSKQCPYAHGIQCGGEGTCSDALLCTCKNSADLGRWSGLACENCADGYWGRTCTDECPGSACNPCSLHGNCSQGIAGTGTCSCGRSNITGYWDGLACERCFGGWFGPNCTKQCPVSITGAVCYGRGKCSDGTAGTGLCTCSGTFAGVACEHCKVGFYGPNCALNCPGPINAPCNLAGSCMNTEQSNGTCSCFYGYGGDACELECPQGPYGRCNNKGLCVQSGGAMLCVNCSSSPSAGYWKGSACSVCQPGYYSSLCNLECPGGASTPCNSKGSCSDGLTGSGACSCNSGYAGLSCEKICAGGVLAPCSGHGVCDSVTGQCSCLSSNISGYWVGDTCSACDSLHSGSSCTLLCPGINSTTNRPCSGHGTCFQGICIVCATGFCGRLCNETVGCAACPAGTFGSSCTACPGGAALPCKGHGTCLEGRFGSGECLCNTSYRGSSCQLRCPGPEGIPCYGRGTCDVTGSCSCTDNWAGADCNIHCAGYDETLSISACNGRGLCNQTDGSCTCRFGFGGVSCDIACPGLNESTQQACSNHGICVNGVCSCFADSDRGFWNGSSCSYCLEGHYDTTCTGNCSHGVSDVANFVCVCDQYWSGAACDVPCPGVDVDNVCYGHGVCSYGMQATGTCTCNSNWYGSNCTTFCTKTLCDQALANGQCQVGSGVCECQFDVNGHWDYADSSKKSSCTVCNIYFYGASCEKPCACSLHGSCDRRTGVCSCFSDPVNGFWGGTTCSTCATGYIGIRCQGLNVQVTPLNAEVAFVPVASLDVRIGILCQDPTYDYFYVGTKPIAIISPSGTTVSSDLGGFALSCYFPTARELYIYTFMEGGNAFVVFDRQTATMLRTENVPRVAASSTDMKVLTRRSRELATTLNVNGSSFTGLSVEASDILAPIQGARVDMSVTAYKFGVIVFVELSSSSTITTTCGLNVIFDLQPGGNSTLMAISGLLRLSSGVMAWDIYIALSSEPLMTPGNTTVVPLIAFGSSYNATLADQCPGCYPYNVFSNGTAVVAIVYAASNAGGKGMQLARMTSKGDPLVIQQFSVAVCNITATILDTFSGYGYFTMNCGEQPSVLQKFNFDTCFVVGTLGFATVGADAEIGVRLTINDAQRVLRILTPLSGLHRIQVVSLYSVTAVLPPIADTKGGTPITVKGQGFVPKMICVFGGATYSAATVPNQYEMVCIAPPGGTASCAGQPVEAFLAGSGSTANQQTLQRVPSAIISYVRDEGTGTNVGFLHASNVTVVGSGFLLTDNPGLLKCLLYSASQQANESLVVDATLISSSEVMCRVPAMTAPTANPSYLEVSLDGTVFSDSHVQYAKLGVATTLSVDQTGGRVEVMAAGEARIPPITVFIADAKHHSIAAFLKILDSSHASHTIAVSSSSATLTGTLLMTTATGAANFSNIALVFPTVSNNVTLTFTDVNLMWTANITLAVVEGNPHAMVFVRLPSLSVLNAQPVLSTQPIIGIVDSSGNTITDLSNKVPRVDKVLAHYITLPTNNEPQVATIVINELNAQFRAEGIAIVGKHQTGYVINFTCSPLAVPLLQSPPVVVGWCSATEYAVENSTACELCPANAICDGTYNIKAEDNWWRADNTTLNFYSCGAPFSGDSCMNNSNCLTGYEGPRCSVCSRGYGRSGRFCEECQAPAAISFLVVTACIVLLGLTSVLMYTLVTTSVDDTLPILLRSFIAYFQMLARLNDMQVQWPYVLGATWRYMEAVANLQAFDFSPFACAMSQDFFGTYVASLFVPWAVIALVAPATMLLAKRLNAEHLEVKTATAIADACRAEEDPNVLKRIDSGGKRRRSSSLNPLAIGADEDDEVADLLMALPSTRGANTDQDEGEADQDSLRIGKGATSRVEFVKSLSSIRNARTTPWSILVVSAVTILTVLYPTLLMNSGQVLRCEQMDLGAGGGLRSVAVNQRNVDCSSDYYLSYRITAISMIMVYGVSIPLGLVGIVLIMQRFGGMVRARAVLAFFVAGFRQELWFWESVNMSRKFLAMLVVVFVANDNLQMITFMWVNVLGLTLHLTFAPYVHQTLHLLESVAHVVLIVTCNFILLFFFLDPSTMGSDWRWTGISAGVIAINGMTVIAFASVIAYVVRQRLASWIERQEEASGADKTDETSHQQQILELMRQHAMEVTSLRKRRQQLALELQSVRARCKRIEQDDSSILETSVLQKWSFPVEEAGGGEGDESDPFAPSSSDAFGPRRESSSTTEGGAPFPKRSSAAAATEAFARAKSSTLFPQGRKQENSIRRSSRVQFADTEEVVQLPSADFNGSSRQQIPRLDFFAESSDDVDRVVPFSAIRGLDNEFWVEEQAPSAPTAVDSGAYDAVKGAIHDTFGTRPWDSLGEGSAFNNNDMDFADLLMPASQRKGAKTAPASMHQLNAETLRQLTQRDLGSLRVIGAVLDDDDEDEGFVPMFDDEPEEEQFQLALQPSTGDKLLAVDQWRTAVVEASDHGLDEKADANDAPWSQLPGDYGYYHDEIAEVEYLEGRIDTPPTPPSRRIGTGASVAMEVAHLDEDAPLDFDPTRIGERGGEGLSQPMDDEAGDSIHHHVPALASKLLRQLDKTMTKVSSKQATAPPSSRRPASEAKKQGPIIPAFFLFDDAEEDDEQHDDGFKRGVYSGAPALGDKASAASPAHFQLDLRKVMEDSDDDDEYPGMPNRMSNTSGGGLAGTTFSFSNLAVASLASKQQPNIPQQQASLLLPSPAEGGLHAPSPRPESLRRSGKKLSYKTAPLDTPEEEAADQKGSSSADLSLKQRGESSQQHVVAVDGAAASQRLTAPESPQFSSSSKQRSRTKFSVSFSEMSGVFSPDEADAVQQESSPLAVAPAAESTPTHLRRPSSGGGRRSIEFMDTADLMEAVGSSGFFPQLHPSPTSADEGQRRRSILQPLSTAPPPLHALPPDVQVLETGLAMAHGTIPIATGLPRLNLHREELQVVSHMVQPRLLPSSSEASPPLVVRTAGDTHQKEPDLFAGLKFLDDDNSSDDRDFGVMHRQGSAANEFAKNLPPVEDDDDEGPARSLEPLIAKRRLQRLPRLKTLTTAKDLFASDDDDEDVASFLPGAVTAGETRRATFSNSARGPPRRHEADNRKRKSVGYFTPRASSMPQHIPDATTTSATGARNPLAPPSSMRRHSSVERLPMNPLAIIGVEATQQSDKVAGDDGDDDDWILPPLGDPDAAAALPASRSRHLDGGEEDESIQVMSRDYSQLMSLGAGGVSMTINLAQTLEMGFLEENDEEVSQQSLAPPISDPSEKKTKKKKFTRTAKSLRDDEEEEVDEVSARPAQASSSLSALLLPPDFDPV